MCIFLSEFYVYHMHSGARGDQKVLDPLELEFQDLELQEVVSYHVGAGNQTMFSTRVADELSSSPSRFDVLVLVW